jgi:LCP family protein required for cell wall assembly
MRSPVPSPAWITGPPRSRPPHRRRGRSLGTAVLVLLGFALSGLGGAGAYFAPAFIAAAQQTGQRAAVPVPSAGTGANAPAIPLTGVRPFTVLLLGSDDDQKFDPQHVLTQSMILVRVNPAANQVTMLSIPRDLWVPLSSGGTSKIDGAYSYGGAAPAIETVRQNFHVRIDGYIWIGLKGLIRLIDLVGGIDVVTSNPVMDDYYPNDIDSQNPYGYQRVAVLPGPQHLDGVHALQYVRSRHSDLRGDFGRSARQQQVLLALRAKAKTLAPTDLPALAVTFNGELKTSMSLEQLGLLLPMAAQLKVEDVHQIVLYGSEYTAADQIDNQDVLIPHWNAILPLAHQTFPSG